MNETEIVLPVSGLFARIRMPNAGEWMHTQRLARETGDPDGAVLCLVSICATLDGEYRRSDEWLKLPAPDAIMAQVQLLKMLGIGVKQT